MSAPQVELQDTADGLQIRIAGDLRTQSLELIEDDIARVTAPPSPVRVDLNDVTDMDTSGAWLVADLKHRLETSGATVTLTGLDPTQQSLMATVKSHPVDDALDDAGRRGLIPWLDQLGQRTVDTGKNLISALAFLGMTLDRLFRAILMPWKLRDASLFSQMEETGLKAVPIVALMGFLIGVVLAFQGATQLQQFGAEVFVVELIAISILRELGILLTAIIVAGRSGSAFTASIGSMKVQEEIDAMRTLGLDPIDVLVVPRTLALLIMLPILGFIADIAGLFGGALMSWINLGVSPGMFVTRLQETTSVWHLAVGLIKAPFFALVISVIACWQAMLVSGSSESVGRRTTASVVLSIFAVIALDAIFSILFSELGV